MGVTVLGIQHRVALRKESVDRNIHTQNLCISIIEVALRKESVDRNLLSLLLLQHLLPSLSARRAWIEISLLCRILFRR